VGVRVRVWVCDDHGSRRQQETFMEEYYSFSFIIRILEIFPDFCFSDFFFPDFKTYSWKQPIKFDQARVRYFLLSANFVSNISIVLKFVKHYFIVHKFTKANLEILFFGLLLVRFIN
jgi:hypothetical protein